MDTMDIDMDFDLESDPIKDFLTNKLQCLHDTTKELTAQLQVRGELLSTLQSHLGNDLSDNLVKIWEVAKKILDGNFVMKLDVKNLTKTALNNIKIILHWNSSEELHYTVKIFEQNNFIPTSSISDQSTIILTILKPKFLTQTTYLLNGIFTYYDGKSLQTVIPGFTLDVADFSNNLDVKVSEVIRGGAHALCGVLSNLNRQEFAIYMGECNARKFNSMLTTDCMLREVNVSFGEKKLFYADSICEAVNGGIFLVHGMKENFLYSMDIFTKNKLHLYQILHYLYKNIDDLQIMPMKYYDKKTQDIYDSNKTFDTISERKQLANSLLEEVNHHLKIYSCSENSEKNVNSDASKAIMMRLKEKLSLAELNTDCIAEKL